MKAQGDLFDEVMLELMILWVSLKSHFLIWFPDEILVKAIEICPPVLHCNIKLNFLKSIRLLLERPGKVFTTFRILEKQYHNVALYPL